MFRFLVLTIFVVTLLFERGWAQTSQMQTASEPEPICYKNPIDEMMKGYAQPVDVHLQDSWKLTELQMNTALQPPKAVQKNGRVHYIYPEDEQPTPEQVKSGAALSSLQRKAMRKARLHERQMTAWYYRKEAENFNRVHSAALSAVEKKGIYLVIHLKKQWGVCMDGDKQLRKFKVCSGKTSTPTPQGHFHVIEKHEKHHSNLYNNASMPYFMRLTVDGVGLHQGNVRSFPASHGCIRLSWDDARYLFNLCRVGTAVFVQD